MDWKKALSSAARKQRPDEPMPQQTRDRTQYRVKPSPELDAINDSC
jgi:hypothetical protein